MFKEGEAWPNYMLSNHNNALQWKEASIAFFFPLEWQWLFLLITGRTVNTKSFEESYLMKSVKHKKNI